MILIWLFAPATSHISQLCREYFTKVIRILEPLQSSYGGPIIALQIENEYAMYGDMNSNDSQNYMKFLYQVWIEGRGWEDGKKGEGVSLAYPTLYLPCLWSGGRKGSGVLEDLGLALALPYIA